MYNNYVLIMKCLKRYIRIHTDIHLPTPTVLWSIVPIWKVKKVEFFMWYKIVKLDTTLKTRKIGSLLMCTKSRKKRCKISSIMIYDYYASPPLPLLNPEFFPLFFWKTYTVYFNWPLSRSILKSPLCILLEF